ncbi:MAG: Z1 domain-containing protein [Christensenellales bacterium]|jgi:hypothetical protein
MAYLDTYLNTIIERGNIELAESIRKTAEDVGNSNIKNFSYVTHEIGLLFGNVQSGKTGQMFGIMSKATDLGFYAFVLLTTDNIVLQQQTLDRVKADLKGYCICGENDSGIFIENELKDPAIIVLKKNSRVLKLWANVFNTTGFMKGNPLFIIDDEADAASLNTLVNKNRQSSINKYLDSIRNSAMSSLYLQVTGTPQAIILQTRASGWHPLFTHYFKPGRGYLGGDFFFPKGQKPECVTYIDELEKPERSVVLRHILVSAQMLSTGSAVSNCLIHPSVRQAAHNSYADKIRAELVWCRENVDGEFASELQKLYRDIHPAKSDLQQFSDILAYAKGLIMGQNSTLKVLIMNGQSDTDSDDYSEGCNFIIGGNTLGRGVTFPKLQTIYYSRTAKKPQADTMWQHSRMFGYDRDPGMMMVYIDEQLYKLFADINATNNAMISQIEQGLEDINVMYSEGVNPTRKNVLDNKHVIAISGGTNYYPFYPDNDDIDAVSTLLGSFSDEEAYYQVSLNVIKTVLSHIIPSPDFKLSSFVSFIETMLSQAPGAQGILIVRRGRDVAQGTGALLSPNDWKLGGSFPRKVVLTMYQVTGTKGWGGKPLWVPNIKLPDGIVYYDVEED